MSKKEKSSDKIGFLRLTLWQTQAVSQAFLGLIAMYLMVYCTDTLRMPAVTVSLILVGSKFIDAFSDTIAGMIVDRTETRWGRGRPYEVFIILGWLFTWMMFSASPGWSLIVKCVWLFCTYTAVNSICVTFLTAAGLPRMTRTFVKESQYVTITSFGSVYTMLFAMVFNIVMPMFIAKFDNAASGWSFLLACIAIPAAIIGALRMILIPEVRTIDEAVDESGQVQKIKFSDVILLLKSNRYYWIILFGTFFFSFISNLGVAVYYFKYIVKNIGLQGMIGFASIIILPLAFVLPQILKKITVARLIKYGFVVSALGFFINFFAGNNMVILVIASIFTGAGAVPISMLVSLLLIDNADYNEYEGRRRLEATMNGIQGFTMKFGNALGTGALGVLLTFSGYTGVMETMPKSSFTMITLLYSLIPMALNLICSLIFNFYKLDDKLPEIKKIINEKREAEKISEEEKEQTVTNDEGLIVINEESA